MIDWIGFDADDTLWKNEEYYLEGREQFLQILQKYGLEEKDIENFDHFEVENIKYFGYGVMSFVLSMIEIAIELTEETIHPRDIQQLIRLAKQMLSDEVEVFPGVPELLEDLSARFPLMLITKGDLLHQRRKFEASGLPHYFQRIEVVSDKSPAVYQEILERHKIDPRNFLMIGNSLRSDILPVLDLGGWAVHLLDHPTWSHEDDPLKEIQQERFLEVNGISQVKEKLEAL
ncbi:MAG: HAD family hydrolase, partial [Anaerolineales bacterium]|nr:HAD family hydrolase [Anaerolineales bacterium]